MKITFVAIGWENLAISLLSAIAKQKGHQTDLAFCNSLFNDKYNLNIKLLAQIFDDKTNVLKKIKNTDPDCVCFSAVTSTYQWMLDIAKDVKKLNPNIKTIFGGVHPTAVPNRVIAQDCVDFVCIGEGDIAFGQILDAIENNNYDKEIPNTLFKIGSKIIKGPQVGFIQDLDSLPFFDKTIWEDHINLNDIYFTMASRGCPYKCTYCFNNFYFKLPGCGKGKYLRHRSVEHVINELKIAKARYKIKIIEFEDDVFTINKKWLTDFLRAYKLEINIPFQCLSHPNALDENILMQLSDSGCKYIQMGIQSMDDTYKRKHLKRLDTTAQIENALYLMNKYKIKAKVDHMFGLPNEPIEAQEKARQIYLKYRPYRIQTFWTNLLPATEMFHQAIEEGRITDQQAEDILDGKASEYYRESSNNLDKKTLKLLKSYETIFKLIAILPINISAAINPKFLSMFPVCILSTISFCADILSGLFKANPDHIAYAKHYLIQMTNSLLISLNFKKIKATKLKTDIIRVNTGNSLKA